MTHETTNALPGPAAAAGRATLIGFVAIACWAALALFTAASGTVPPFQMTAMTFAIGALVGLLVLGRDPARLASALRQPLKVWALGIYGLFGYHALYFIALRLAPPAESGLINYLWPLLIVLFSGLLPGEKLRAHHLFGAVLGFAGVVVLIAGAGGLSLQAAHLPGYLAALACAFVWSSYSVGSRLMKSVPTETVVGFCAVTAVLAALCHLAFETTQWPQTGLQWAAVAALGLGPVGIAFYTWDYGVKQGDIRVLGAASYAAPVLSTVLLVAFGFAAPTASLWIACGLITLGAVVASKDLLQGSKPGEASSKPSN